MQNPPPASRLDRLVAWFDDRDRLAVTLAWIFLVAATVGGFLISAVAGCFALAGAALVCALLLGLG